MIAVSNDDKWRLSVTSLVAGVLVWGAAIAATGILTVLTEYQAAGFTALGGFLLGMLLSYVGLRALDTWSPTR